MANPQLETYACQGLFVYGDIFPLDPTTIDWRGFNAPFANSPAETVPFSLFGSIGNQDVPLGTAPTPIAWWVYNGLTERYCPLDANRRRIGPFRPDLPLRNGQVFRPNLKIRGSRDIDWDYDDLTFFDVDYEDADDGDDDDIDDMGEGDGSAGGGGGGGGKPGGGGGKPKDRGHGGGYFPVYTPGMYAGPPST